MGTWIQSVSNIDQVLTRYTRRFGYDYNVTIMGGYACRCGLLS